MRADEHASTPLGDVLFLGPLVVPGDDLPAYVADVLVTNGLIARIGEPGTVDSPNARRVQGHGCILCPGFIDMHAHSDLYLLSHPAHEPKISQGCTTEVIGQDGISYTPVRTDKQLRAIRDQIAGWNGNPSDEECATSLKGVGMFEWTTCGEYVDCLERNQTATNVCALVPQGNLRLLACGPEDKPCTADELQEQVALLSEAMSQGAVGMSSGLTYTPGMYASTEELTELCRHLAQHFPGSYYCPHTRSYGKGALDAYKEMLDIGRETGCPIHLTHATMNFAENADRAHELTSMIDAARKDGVAVSLDSYPYSPSCTTLASLLPSWASSGGPDATLERLEKADLRERIRREMEEEGCDGGHGIPVDWETIQVGATTHPDLAPFSGRRIAEIAKKLNKPPVEVCFDILRKDRLATSCIMHVGHENNVKQIMRHACHCGGSDGILHGQNLHPRAYGTFPRFLGHYARDEKIMSITDMIPHLTSRPAKRLGIFPHRGLVAEGSAADLVLFDPEKIRDMATFDQSKQPALGIRFVLVNGRIALDEGKMVGIRAGKVLRRRQDGSVW